jgi:hypothetical protein
VAKRKKLLLRPHQHLPLLPLLKPHLLLSLLLQLLTLLATLPRRLLTLLLTLPRQLLPSKLFGINKRPPSGGFLLCSDADRLGKC